MLARGWSFPVAKMSSNAMANYECVFNSFWMLNTSYKVCVRSDVHSVMCLWISDWRVDLMILSHVRSKKLKVQTHTWGAPQIIKFFEKFKTVRTFVNNRSTHINNDVFCTSKDSFVPIQDILEFWSWVLELYLNVLEFCPDKNIRTLYNRLSSDHSHPTFS